MFWLAFACLTIFVSVHCATIYPNCTSVISTGGGDTLVLVQCSPVNITLQGLQNGTTLFVYNSVISGITFTSATLNVQILIQGCTLAPGFGDGIGQIRFMGPALGLQMLIGSSTFNKSLPMTVDQYPPSSQHLIVFQFAAGVYVEFRDSIVNVSAPLNASSQFIASSYAAVVYFSSSIQSTNVWYNNTQLFCGPNNYVTAMVVAGNASSSSLTVYRSTLEVAVLLQTSQYLVSHFLQIVASTVRLRSSSQSFVLFAGLACYNLNVRLVQVMVYDTSVGDAYFLYSPTFGQLTVKASSGPNNIQGFRCIVQANSEIVDSLLSFQSITFYRFLFFMKTSVSSNVSVSFVSGIIYGGIVQNAVYSLGDSWEISSAAVLVFGGLIASVSVNASLLVLDCNVTITNNLASTLTVGYTITSPALGLVKGTLLHANVIMYCLSSLCFLDVAAVSSAQNITSAGVAVLTGSSSGVVIELYGVTARLTAPEGTVRAIALASNVTGLTVSCSGSVVVNNGQSTFFGIFAAGDLLSSDLMFESSSIVGTSALMRNSSLLYCGGMLADVTMLLSSMLVTIPSIAMVSAMNSSLALHAQLANLSLTERFVAVGSMGLTSQVDIDITLTNLSTSGDIVMTMCPGPLATIMIRVASSQVVMTSPGQSTMIKLCFSPGSGVYTVDGNISLSDSQVGCPTSLLSTLLLVDATILNVYSVSSTVPSLWVTRSNLSLSAVANISGAVVVPETRLQSARVVINSECAFLSISNGGLARILVNQTIFAVLGSNSGNNSSALICGLRSTSTAASTFFSFSQSVVTSAATLVAVSPPWSVRSYLSLCQTSRNGAPWTCTSHDSWCVDPCKVYLSFTATRLQKKRLQMKTLTTSLTAMNSLTLSTGQSATRSRVDLPVTSSPAPASLAPATNSAVLVVNSTANLSTLATAIQKALNLSYAPNVSLVGSSGGSSNRTVMVTFATQNTAESLITAMSTPSSAIASALSSLVFSAVAVSTASPTAPNGPLVPTVAPTSTVAPTTASPAPSLGGNSSNGGAIAAGIIVPLVIIGIGLAFFVWYRRQKSGTPEPTADDKNLQSLMANGGNGSQEMTQKNPIPRSYGEVQPPAQYQAPSVPPVASQPLATVPPTAVARVVSQPPAPPAALPPPPPPVEENMDELGYYDENGNYYYYEDMPQAEL